ncbi:YdbH domain-containing protein [Marinobacterium sp. MBR-109]|jgi:hypothetical protein|uniref:intermembrane phospholipid transport protein YdbH family protein n=1 Tax=Marinobacterium sp. MBR-109 TaxID=3156462 RepID=UPI003393CF0C
MKKWLGLLFLLPLLLAGMAWLSLPWSAQYLVERWLAEQGFVAPAFTMRHPSWEKLQIDHLSVSQAGDGRRVTLSADNIELQFDPMNLLQGQLAELRVQQARLDIVADHSLKGRAEQIQRQPEPIALNRFHPQQLFSYAPSRRLVIAQLELNYTAPEQPPLTLLGNVDLEPQLLQGRFQIKLDQKPLGYLDFNFDPDYQLQLSFSDTRQPLVQSDLRLTPDPHSWKFEAETTVQIEPLRSALESFQIALPEEVRPLSGVLKLNSRLELPAQLASDVQTLLRLDSHHDIAARLRLPGRNAVPNSDLDLQARLQFLDGSIRLQLKPSTRLVLQRQDMPELPPISLSADLQWLPHAMQIKGPITLRTQEPPLQLDTELTLDARLNGRVGLNLPPVQLASLLPTLKRLLPQQRVWPDVHQGQLQARGELRLNEGQWQLELRPGLTQANLSLDNTHIHNLNLDSRLELAPNGRLSARGNLSIGHTDTGLRIYGPDLDYALTGYGNSRYWLQLTAFSLSALDGIIAVPAVGFDPLKPDLETRLAVSAFDLSRILELYPQEGLYGSGVLGGELPIRINGNEISIHNGHLRSGAEGGVIRYQPTPEVALMGQQNPGVQLALRALTDLRFELLDLKLDYQPNGDADMRARLKGYNPGWQQGRPVDLNLNIEENLLALLRTLQLTGRVTDSIDRRFRR